MTDLIRKELAQTILLTGRYAEMLDRISSSLPATMRDSESFHKLSSQYKSVTLDITDLTPTNTARHLLAVITRTRQALEEAEVTLRRKTIQLRRTEKLMAEEVDEITRDEYKVTADELSYQISNLEASVRGAIRRIDFSIAEYQQILDFMGVETITEDMYEADEARYHVMTAFNQALTAARARGGLIDEGNHIYLFQIGVNGAVAQNEVTRILQAEQQIIAQGGEPTHQLIIDWLNYCADKFEGCGRDFVESRGLVSIDERSLMTAGDLN